MPRRSGRTWSTTTASPAGYQSVKRFVRKLRGSQRPEARAVIDTAPGEEAQVDYGDGPMVRDPNTGKYRRTRLFVLTLGYSRKCVRLLSFRSSSRIWAELHETGLPPPGRRRLAWSCSTTCAKACSRPTSTIPRSTRSIATCSRTTAPSPCRAAFGDPDRKGKVESGVGHAQKTPLKGQRFESLEEAQAYLDHWEERWADTRIHGTTKRQVAAMFAEEKPALLPLPLEPFRYYQYGERTVHLDGCVEVEAAYYSAPPGWIGRRVQVQWDGRHVRLLDPAHRPAAARAFAPGARPPSHPGRGPPASKHRCPPYSCWRAPTRPAPHIGALCQRMHRSRASRPCAAFWACCRSPRSTAPPAWTRPAPPRWKSDVCDYRFVRRYLERQPALPLSLRQVDPLIRQLTLYRDLIEEQNHRRTNA